MKSTSDSFKSNTGAHSFKGAASFTDHLNNTALYEAEDNVVENFDSLVGEMRDWLKDRDYKQAEVLMDLMLECNKEKTRQDGITPSALHEITQAVWFINCIESGLHVDDKEGIISVIFAHDLGEDFGFSPQYMENHLLKNGVKSRKDIDTFKTSFDAISKRYGKNGPDRYKNEYKYSCAVRGDRNASVAKMFDRAHNVMTLVGVKDKLKIADYTAKTLQLQHDNVEAASSKFPAQESIYKTLQQLIRQEVQTCYYYIVDTGKKITDNDDLDIAMPQKGFKDLPLGLHPLIVAAERIRHTYPDTHLAENNDADIDQKNNYSNDDNPNFSQ
ncbi:MAG: hypothetical protein COA45_10520 [Zetaproteobacteria bacterium]|nr:MAG: hypothetical protein COA45_10520 [Zetaproteobacteria bacterium]